LALADVAPSAEIAADIGATALASTKIDRNAAHLSISTVS
jgi:hypothetical protein